MDTNLRGRTALVSGSTLGIGYASAAGLARCGAHVVVNGRTAERTDAAVARIRAAQPDADVVGFAADLATAEGVAALVAAHPEVDVLVNNLGIFEPRAFEEISDAEWMRFFEVNVLSGVRLSRAYLPYMRTRNWGRIIFVSSESGLQTPTEMIHYGTTKTAQLAVARGLAELVAGTGITVNSVLPGPTRTEGVDDFLANLARARGVTVAQVETSFFKESRPTSVIRRFLTADEVASMVVYAASPGASGTTGASLRVEGGIVRHI